MDGCGSAASDVSERLNGPSYARFNTQMIRAAVFIMQRRLLALTLGLAVAGAPQALTACYFACAESRADSAGREGHHGHSGHHVSAPISAVALQASSHPCDHDEQLPTAVGASSKVKAPPAIVTAAAALSLPLDAARAHEGAFLRSPPGPAFRAIALRI
jgi:hypothetical protein